AVMAGPPTPTLAENSALLFHVDAKIDFLQERVEQRSERFQEDLIRDFNDLKAKLRHESRKANFYAFALIVVGFVSAYFAIYGKMASYLENQIEQRAEKEFETERIQSIVAAEAEKYTSAKGQTLIQSKIDSATKAVDTLKTEQADVTKLIATQ